jgi:Circularly permutated YpsA SLOG family
MKVLTVRIVSGGQTGVDQAALRAAQDCGLACGGWCPPGHLCESGIIPARFSLQETPDDRSPEAPDIPRSQRTEWNVRDSDATLILGPADAIRNDPGTNWAITCAKRYHRPLLIIDPSDRDAAGHIAHWLQTREIETLNVAGPSEATGRGIGEQAYSLLRRVFSAS